MALPASGYRGRYAPSPTGALHLGNARTALLAWLDARAHGGTFVLRMEDLDPQRSSVAAAEGIVRDLGWLGLDWDEGPDVGGAFGPYTQSERSAIYEDAIARLVREGRAFPCSCSRAEVMRAAGAPHAGEDGPRYPGTCRAGPTHPGRPCAIRLRVEQGEVGFHDGLHGEQRVDVGAQVGDFVIRRVDGVAAYQLAVAVDDSLQAITHVVRGDDLLTSTPRQLLVLSALGLRAPAYAHVPLMVGSDGHRLAKRSGSLTLEALRERGVSPRRVIGWLAETAGIQADPEVDARDLVAGFRLGSLPRTPSVVTAFP